MHSQVRNFTIIAVILSLVGYSFLFIQGQRLNSENEEKKKEIADKVDRIDGLRAEIIKEEQELKSLRKEKEKLKETQDELIDVIADSKDEETLKKGEEVVKKKGIVNSKFFVVTSEKDRSYNDALRFEQMGFDALLEKDVDAALEAFIKSENSYNSFHQVYEIAKYLEENKQRLSQGDERSWQEAYAKVIEFDWKMPKEVKQRLKRELEPSTN